MRFEVVSFDAAGTLFGVAEPVSATYARHAERFGIEVCPDRLSDDFRHAFAGMPPMAFGAIDADQRRHLEQCWWRQLVQRVFKLDPTTAQFDALFDALYAHYECGDAWRVFAEVGELLPMLRAAGHRLAVTSNFDSRLEIIIQDLGLAEFFDCVNCSSQIGSEKPDGGIFQHMLAAMGVAPDAALHVGDNFAADYEGARRAGIFPVWLDRGSAARPRPGVRVVDDLTGLWPYLT